ncbi:hypothetical protein CEXT_372421 [Caerostris extrusa]|uniref:Uncharacterized protein n=1 Tax=Caerostris extrusa TaxID=172846 RepID=A0AAV4QDI3_CAEEX|nr:hypothetical protein CEXT_372421 [Caerostris extrusa]
MKTSILDMEDISSFIPEMDLYESQSFLSECQEISLKQPHCYTLDTVTKYRKFMSWWIFVRRTPRIMVSDFRSLFSFHENLQVAIRNFLKISSLWVH